MKKINLLVILVLFGFCLIMSSPIGRLSVIANPKVFFEEYFTYESVSAVTRIAGSLLFGIGIFFLLDCIRDNLGEDKLVIYRLICVAFVVSALILLYSSSFTVADFSLNNKINADIFYSVVSKAAADRTAGAILLGTGIIKLFVTFY